MKTKLLLILMAMFCFAACNKQSLVQQLQQQVSATPKILYIHNGVPKLVDNFNFDMALGVQTKFFFVSEFDSDSVITGRGGKKYNIIYKNQLIDQVILTSDVIISWQEQENIFESIVGGPALAARGIDPRDWKN